MEKWKLIRSGNEDDHAMKYTMDEIKEKSISIAQQYGIQQLELFGFYACGEEKEDNDLDFLIDRYYIVAEKNRPPQNVQIMRRFLRKSHV